jgi:hypothetical protein
MSRNVKDVQKKSDTLRLFNIAMENAPFILDFPLNMVIFHSYVSLTEGIFSGF